MSRLQLSILVLVLAGCGSASSPTSTHTPSHTPKGPEPGRELTIVGTLEGGAPGNVFEGLSEKIKIPNDPCYTLVVFDRNRREDWCRFDRATSEPFPADAVLRRQQVIVTGTFEQTSGNITVLGNCRMKR